MTEEKGRGRFAGSKTMQVSSVALVPISHLLRSISDEGFSPMFFLQEIIPVLIFPGTDSGCNVTACTMRMGGV